MKTSAILLFLILIIGTFNSVNAQGTIGPVYYRYNPTQADVPDWWYGYNVLLEGWGTKSEGEAAPNEVVHFYCGNLAFSKAAWEWGTDPASFYDTDYGRIYDVTVQPLEIQYNAGGGTPRFLPDSFVAKATNWDLPQNGPSGP